MARSLRSARILALGAGALAAALAACSLLTGLDADYKSRAAPGDEGGTDGDATSDGAGRGDARDDTGPGDGGAGGSGRFCDLNGDAAGVVYCCDFEDNSCLWDVDEQTLGSFKIEPNIGANGSSALRATIVKPGGSVFRSRRLPTGPFNGFRRHEFSFAFSLKTKSSLSTADLGAVGFGTLNPFTLKYVGVAVYKGATQDLIDISSPPGLNGTHEQVSVGDWRRATIAMDRGTVPTAPYVTTVTVTSAAGTLTQVDMVAFDGGAADTQILVGAFFTSVDPDGGVETVIDDILLKQTK